MERKPIWQEIHEVRFGAVDNSDSMTLDTVFNYFQEAAISHAENLGVGREALARDKQAWIISRMSVQVMRRPKYRENIIVRTWPCGGEKLFAFRNYEILDSSGYSAVRAKSCWLIIDTEKRRPLRPKTIVDSLPANEGQDLPITVRCLEEHPGLLKTDERRALYSDLDYNGHVNNVSYIKWLEDAMDSALLEQAVQLQFDINYLNEILPGETAGIWSAVFDVPAALAAGEAPSHAFAFEGRKVPGGQPAFRAELQLW